MKIVIFGGTFDPVHNEHRSICMQASAQLRPDLFLVIPAKFPPHKSASGVTGAVDRAQMAKLGLAKIPNVEFSDFELSSPGKSYSYLTLEHLRREHPDAEITFLIGGDSLRDFFKWREPERIAELCTVAVARRLGAGDLKSAVLEFEKRTGKSPIVLDYTGADVSSTELKALIAYGIDVSELVPAEVLDYIAEKRLYREHEQLIRESEKFLSEKRFRHTAWTVACAMLLAKRAGADPEKTFVAAALHDVAKKMTDEQLAALGFFRDGDMPEPVVHAFAGAHVAEVCFGVHDREILDAIRFHTTGRPDMTPLEKVIYTADCVEKTRDYEGVGALRREVERDFEHGFVACLKGTMLLLSEKEGRKAVSELTAQAYEYYKIKGEIE